MTLDKYIAELENLRSIYGDDIEIKVWYDGFYVGEADKPYYFDFKNETDGEGIVIFSS